MLDESSVGGLAATLRQARREARLSQAEVGERAGVSASYVSRIECAAWRDGGPWPSEQVLRSLARVLGLSSTGLIDECQDERSQLSDAVGADSRRGGWPGPRYGYSAHTGDDAFYEAGRRLLSSQPGRSKLRVTNLLPGPSQEPQRNSEMEYLRALADTLTHDPGAVLCRVASESCPGIWEMTEKLVGRDPQFPRRIRSRLCPRNPLVLDVVIGTVAALIGFPDRRADAYPRACILIDDPDVVRAMQEWFDEFVWDGGD